MSGPDNDPAATPLPRWKCHKEVWAAKIVEVVDRPDGLEKNWRLENGGIIHACGMLSARVPDHASALGGYYVRYEDGYESWSPAKAFEEGYTRVA